MEIEKFDRTKIVYGSLIIIQCLIFGISFVAVKSLLDVGMPTFLLITIRFTIGACFLFGLSKLFNCFQKNVKKIVRNNNFTKKEFTSGLIAGILLFAAFALQTAGANTTTPAKNGLFTDLFVIFVPIITMIFVSKKFSVWPLLLSLLAFIGLMFIVNIFAEQISFGIGDLLSIFCGVVFAVHFIMLEKFSFAEERKDRLNPYNFTVIQLIVVAVLGLNFSLLMELNSYTNIVWSKTMGWLIFLGVLSSAVAYLLQFLAQEKITAEVTSVLSCSDAIFVLIFALAFGFDKFSWHFIIGAIILITSMTLSSFNFRENKIQKEISAIEEEKN
jgi:drug/metabolite transporter (DMT)-like permease